MEMQKAYGQKYDPKVTMQAWEYKLAGRFSIEQIIYALDKYTDKHEDFPTPKNIIEILNPEAPRISEAEFVAAQKWQERNAFPVFSDAKDVIDKYNEQEHKKRGDFNIECKKLKELVRKSLIKEDKRIVQCAIDAGVSGETSLVDTEQVGEEILITVESPALLDMEKEEGN